MNQNSFYPVMLNLKGKKCTVVGGGKIALRKIKGLVEGGARVKVVSPKLTPELEQIKKEGKITHVCRQYRKEDVENSFLVIGATQKRKVNEKIATEAKEKGSLVNIVDSPFLCNFFVPSFLKRGRLTISISTEGASPFLSKKVGEELERIYGEEYETFLDWMEQIREVVIKNVKDKYRRKQIFSHVVNCEILDLLRAGEKEKAKKHFFDFIKRSINAYADKSGRFKPYNIPG